MGYSAEDIYKSTTSAAYKLKKEESKKGTTFLPAPPAVEKTDVEKKVDGEKKVPTETSKILSNKIKEVPVQQHVELIVKIRIQIQVEQV
jgi:hypothetical protein